MHVTEPVSLQSAAPSIYDRIGVPRIINARGATTAVGGTLSDPRVLEAMAEASRSYVVIEDLNARVGEKIAEITGAEAGYVTCGSCAAMLLAAAACMAGTDPVRIRQLPDTTGMADEIVIHRAHRLDYDQMYRAAGAKLVEIGVPFTTHAWELEAAITDRTAAVAFHDSPNVGPGALDFRTVVQIAHERGVPVIVDAASTLPPVDHLRKWIRDGADLVIYSGGKGIRGPQDSGLLAGRHDLIDAARANGSPNPAVGRGMKVSKEALAGLWMAIEVFLETDHDAERRTHQAEATEIADALSARADSAVIMEDNWEDWPAPVVKFRPVDGAWNPREIHAALKRGNPPIHCDLRHGGLMFNTHCLQEGDAGVIVQSVTALLG
ncbi:MAG: aminotransferase class V-fold PLP-dependent enzyme [Thermomicrobiales bacterium]|nr:aminotransferase class V-fold PLP-dependent enzyme [Thermomicrobiales bacterium]